MNISNDKISELQLFDLNTIFDTEKNLLNTFNTKIIILTFLYNIIGRFGLDSIVFMWIDKNNKNRIVTYEARGIDKDELKNIAFRVKGELATFLLKNIDNVKMLQEFKTYIKNKKELQYLKKLKTEVCLPLIVKNKLRGMIHIGRKIDGSKIKEDEINFIKILTGLVTLVLENIRLYEASITDGLLNIYTNKFFQKSLENEIKNAIRYNYNFSLLFIDVDDFKIINDKYGHQVGDEALKNISSIIKKNIRESDIFARYGGDEFSIILSHCDLKNAKKIAYKIKENINNNCVLRNNLKIKSDKKDSRINLSIGISIGIATFKPEKYKDKKKIDFKFQKDLLLKRADSALYKAKENGKNSIMVYK